jgi:hypothetical protein
MRNRGDEPPGVPPVSWARTTIRHGLSPSALTFGPASTDRASQSPSLSPCMEACPSLPCPPGTTVYTDRIGSALREWLLALGSDPSAVVACTGEKGSAGTERDSNHTDLVFDGRFDAPSDEIQSRTWPPEPAVASRRLSGLNAKPTEGSRGRTIIAATAHRKAPPAGAEGAEVGLLRRVPLYVIYEG